MSLESERKRVAIFEGEAKIGEVIPAFMQIQLKPEDFTSPVSLQMALSRIYEALMSAVQRGPEKKYIAEVRFKDALGNTIVFAIDLGSSPPPFTKREVKARILIEIFEEE